MFDGTFQKLKRLRKMTEDASSATGGSSGTNMTGKNNFGIMAVCADGSYHKFIYDERKEDFTRDNYHMFVESDSK